SSAPYPLGLSAPAGELAGFGCAGAGGACDALATLPMLTCDRYATQLPSSGCVASVDGSPLPRNSNRPTSTGGSALCCGGSAARPLPDAAASAAVTTAMPMRCAMRISGGVLV